MKCERCNAVLGGKRDENGNYDRPAEVYLATYTGLCDRCMRAAPYTVRREWDGAQIISYPPLNPAWRRNREEYVAYADCKVCNGQGQWMHERSYAFGGPYREQCYECLTRYANDVWRKRWQMLHERLYEEIEQKARQEICQACQCKPHDLHQRNLSVEQLARAENIVMRWRERYIQEMLKLEEIISNERALLQQR